MKTTQLLVPVLGSLASAATVPNNFDLNGACVKACDQYLGPKSFATIEDRQRANLDCHNGCMDIANLPNAFIVEDPRDVQKRESHADQIHQQIFQGVEPTPEMSQASNITHAMLLCVAGCDPDDDRCGFACFTKMIPSDDDDSPDIANFRRESEEEPDFPGDASDEDEWPFSDPADQAVLAARGNKDNKNRRCLESCPCGDLENEKSKNGYKCVSKCVQDAGFNTNGKVKGENVLEHTWFCVKSTAQALCGRPAYKENINKCQDELDKVGDQRRKAQLHQRAASTSEEIVAWTVSTSTWATSGTMAMVMPTVRQFHTSTTTVIAEATATETVEIGVMSVNIPSTSHWTVTRTPTPRPKPKYVTSELPYQATSYVVMEVPAETTSEVVIENIKEVPKPTMTFAYTTVTSSPEVSKPTVTISSAKDEPKPAPPAPTSSSSCTEPDCCTSKPNMSTSFTHYTIQQAVTTGTVGDDGKFTPKKKSSAVSSLATLSATTVIGLSGIVAAALLL